MQEIFKTFKKTKHIWEISNLGRVKKDDKIFIPRIDKSGYCNLGKGITVHRLVAEFFIPNSDLKSQVNHINGIKTDNRIENLEWVTRSENMKHAFKIGLCNTKGFNNPNSKLNEEKVNKIKILRSSGMIYSKIAKEIGVSTMTVYNTVNKIGKT